MKVHKLAALTCALFVLTALGCRSGGGGSFATDSRVFLGIALDGDSGPPMIARTIPESAAAAVGLQAGDRIDAFRGAPVEDVEALHAAVRTSRPFEPAAMKVTRDGEPLLVTLVPGFAFVGQTHDDNPKLNKFCDKDCQCTLDQSGFFCFTFWIYLREEFDGLVFLLRCVSTEGPGQPDFVSECIVRNVI